MRTRDHRVLPYAHFYARNGFLYKRLNYMHTINVGESPFATLRLAATLTVLSVLGLVVAAISMTNGPSMYDLRGATIAVIVSAPGILASWARQVFGIKALHQACLTTQIALRLTTAFSILGLVLAVMQDAGLLRWNVRLKLFAEHGWQIPIHDGLWLILCALALTAGAFIYARYLKRRAQYLTLLRRALISDGKL